MQNAGVFYTDISLLVFPMPHAEVPCAGGFCTEVSCGVFKAGVWEISMVLGQAGSTLHHLNDSDTVQILQIYSYLCAHAQWSKRHNTARDPNETFHAMRNRNQTRTEKF